MRNLTLILLACLAIGGCTSYRGGKVVDGTNLEIGIAVPGTDWTINFLSYTGGMTVKGNDLTAISVTNSVTETNSYFGVIQTRRVSNLTATIEPVSVERPSQEEQ